MATQATPQVLVRWQFRLYLQLRLSQSSPCEGTPFFAFFEDVFLVQLHLVILEKITRVELNSEGWAQGNETEVIAHPPKNTCCRKNVRQQKPFDYLSSRNADLVRFKKLELHIHWNGTCLPFHPSPHLSCLVFQPPIFFGGGHHVSCLGAYKISIQPWFPGFQGPPTSMGLQNGFATAERTKGLWRWCCQRRRANDCNFLAAFSKVLNPFSHNNRKWKLHEITLNEKELNIGDTPIFHFHNYWRKGKGGNHPKKTWTSIGQRPTSCPCNICNDPINRVNPEW